MPTVRNCKSLAAVGFQPCDPLSPPRRAAACLYPICMLVVTFHIWEVPEPSSRVRRPLKLLAVGRSRYAARELVGHARAWAFCTYAYGLLARSLSSHPYPLCSPQARPWRAHSLLSQRSPSRRSTLSMARLQMARAAVTVVVAAERARWRALRARRLPNAARRSRARARAHAKSARRHQALRRQAQAHRQVQPLRRAHHRAQARRQARHRRSACLTTRA